MGVSGIAVTFQNNSLSRVAATDVLSRAITVSTAALYSGYVFGSSRAC